MERYARSVFIRAPIETVFGFHEQPDALQRLVPPFERVEVLIPPSSLAVGTLVRIRMHMGPFSIVWDAEHVVYDPPNLFVDRQLRGPFTLWEHHHRFESRDGGTLLTDEVRYMLPLGPLGKLFGNGFTRRRLDKMFAYRHEVTRAACETKQLPSE